MQDYFIPEMRYTYTYTSPKRSLHPARWETTIAESGNGVALYDVLTGKSWNDKDKKMFKNPYSQFLKLETDYTKTLTIDSHSKIVGHVNAGLIYHYGNSDWIPNSEMFYVGGANSIRAFSVRGIGPGSFPGIDDKAYSYLMQNGDIKFVANVEYRRQLFGSLYGAVFLDAGNVWTIEEEFGDELPGYGTSQFKLKDAFRQMAVGTGIGIRYDLDFLILRLDWGVALHLPYETEKSGFYNIPEFKGSHTLHFAIGYPF
jgi:outer membrane protein assembly factor BamA